MKLAVRLGLAYGLIFAIVLLGIGWGLFVTVRTTIAGSVADGLTDVARIAAHHINRAVWARSELLDRNRRIVEQWAAGTEIEFGPTTPVPIISDYPFPPVTVEGAFVTGVEPEKSLARSLAELRTITEAEIAILQRFDNGLVVVDSTGPRDGERVRGYFWPRSSAHFQLTARSGGWVGRQYFDATWYLAAYVPLTDAQDVYVRVAVEQIQLDILGRDLMDIDLGDGGYIYVLDTSSNVVFDPNMERIGENLSVEPWARQIAFGRSGTVEYNTDLHYLAAYDFIDSMNWVVVVATTTEAAFREVETLTRIFGAMLSLAVLLTMIVSMLLGRQISRPVAEVARRFTEIADGAAEDAELIAPPRGSREVRALVRDFNRYVHRTLELNQLERREVALELRQEQMKALQAQINPHFLYNTLETIRFLIEMGDPRAVGTVQTLSDLFRVSLARGERFTTLEAEIEHAGLYFEIQTVRYPSLLDLRIDVPYELQKASVVSFFLQPIVENAVVHAIVPSGKPGTIEVRAREQDGDLVVTIVDDGMGISESNLDAIRMNLADRNLQDDAIGLRNVHDRLRLIFGQGYGLEIHSERQTGTTVVLRMPHDQHRKKVS